MFTRLAEFRLVQSRRTAPGPREAFTHSNDNLPGLRRPGGQRRIPSPVLTCHWFLIDGGTRLGCRWLAEASTQTAPEDSDAEQTSKRTSGRKRPGLAIVAVKI